MDRDGGPGVNPYIHICIFACVYIYVCGMNGLRIDMHTT